VARLIATENLTHSGRILQSIELWDERTHPRQQVLALIRVLCHALVDRLPEASLPELLESLRAIYEFHQDQMRLSVHQLPVARISARIGRSYVRPTFEIEEE
jgi:hypothetical protein